MRGSGSTSDADIERKVSASARNFFDGVQRIIAAAKRADEWNIDLLKLCTNFGEPGKLSDLDILLQNAKCEKFVLRCLEQELPPNLIHCLRLLRVLELENADSEININFNEASASEPGSKDQYSAENFHLLSKDATAKVKNLLCLLCVDPIVGEQLRPHVFGLLKLSGASYPPNGVHIAKAASDVIILFAERCLSTTIVKFLHEHNMIVFMTEDIKELCGMTKETKSLVPNSLTGKEAEEAGLWVTSLNTIVHLVTHSCQYDCFELVTDFENAGGYHILTYAISHSSEKNMKEILKLVSILVCCQTDASYSPVVTLKTSPHFADESKLATNIRAFVIVEDLMVRSIPLLQTYADSNQGKVPDISKSNLQSMVKIVISSAKSLTLSSTNVVAGYDMLSELLIVALQLYSDNCNNFNIIEPKFNILSQYLLSFPTFKDVSLKILTLKTLEYVCTGIPNSDAVRPLTVACEVFTAMCTALLGGEHGSFYDGIRNDAEMLCQTLEKLLQVDRNIAKILNECGLQGEKMNTFLSLVVTRSEEFSAGKEINNELASDEIIPGPPRSTEIDEAFGMLCRILKFITQDQPVKDNSSGSNHSVVTQQQSSDSSRINLHVLLTMGITSLGDHASKSALSVFEAILRNRKAHDSLHDDVSCLIDVLDQLSTVTSKRYPLSKFCPLGLDSKSISRQLDVISVFQNSFQINESVQDMFKKRNGYESLIRAVKSVKEGYVNRIDAEHNHSDDENNSSAAIINLLTSIFPLLSLSIVPTDGGKYSTATSRKESILNTSFSEKNKLYLYQSGFYTKFSNAIMNTGILISETYAYRILKLALSLMAPSIIFTDDQEFSGCKTLEFVDNPHAVRLFLGIAVNLPNELISLSKKSMNAILDLCGTDKNGSTLPQISSSGLTKSLTKENEFGNIIQDNEHALHSHFILLLKKLAAYNMSYCDFVNLARCIVGPILFHDIENYKRIQGQIDIPIISSSIQASSRRNPQYTNTFDYVDEHFQALETDFCFRLETLSEIAKKGDCVSRCVLGGDNLNTVALYLQKVPVEDRFFHLAEKGRVKFINIESIDSSALQNMPSSGTVSSASATGADKIWPPLVSAGFSYSFWLRIPLQPKGPKEGSLFLLDLSSHNYDNNVHHVTQTNTSMAPSGFISVWFNTLNQEINVSTSSAPRTRPVSLPKTSLCKGVWNHIILAYQPPKRSIMQKKATLSIHINGRPLGNDIAVDHVNLPPTSQVHIGVPNPVFAASGIVRDPLPFWELGPNFLVSGILSSKDATAIFSAGPEFKGLFWGDRPQRLSLTATATATFAMLAEIGEKGSVASSLRRRNMPEVETSEQVLRGKNSQDDNLSSVGLDCSIKHENVVFGFNAHAYRYSTGQKGWKVLVNTARLNKASVSTDAQILGSSSIIDPVNFADNLQWIGGPKLLFPLVNAVKSSATLALTLKIIRESSQSHIPNLETLQVGGGYRILGLLLRQKLLMDKAVMNECFAFGVNGFRPGLTTESLKKFGNSEILIPTWSGTENWVLSDLYAIKYLLLNHQVWDLRRSGPELPLRLLSFLNSLVSSNNFHAGFNSRRLHLLGIVEWTIHLMLEAAELYDSVSDMSTQNSFFHEKQARRNNPSSQAWRVTPPSLKHVSVGGDPDNPILQCCKTLLRRVLTFMLTPYDLRDVVGATIYTLSISNGIDFRPADHKETDHFREETIAPGPVARIYLLRLLEELVVDGVNEIVSVNAETSASRSFDTPTKESRQQNGNGSASSNQSYLASTMGTLRRHRSSADDVTQHPKHQQAQLFLSAFASILTPVWFACVLEGSYDEASAGAALRLLILMLQSSRRFCSDFEQSSGFSPLVLSIPKFSTSPNIILALISQLLHAPILRLPCLATLEPSILMEVFDFESDTAELVSLESSKNRPKSNADPCTGIFALLAECLGRNIQLGAIDNPLGRKARETNEAVIKLLSHRHSFSSFFQEFCRTQDFLEPLAQSLCLIHDTKMKAQMSSNSEVVNTVTDDIHDENHDQSTYDLSGEQFTDGESHSLNYKKKRRSSLSEVDTTLTPTERFVGSGDDAYTASGFGMVNLIHLVLSHAVLNGQLAAVLLFDLFRSFPIHASLEQVEAYHLVLIEHCSRVVGDALQRGKPVAVSNCIGLSSVLLDRVMNGFFTAEPLLDTVNIILKTLRFLTANGTNASRTIGNIGQYMLVTDAAHLARLTCLTVLRRSCPRNPYDEGDDDLKFEILKKLATNLRQLLVIPITSGPQSAKRGQTNQLGSYEPPAFGTPMYVLYLCSSLSRYPPYSRSCNFSDLYNVEKPDRAFVVALMSLMHRILRDERLDIREQSVEVIVSLLQQRKGFMSELLISDIRNAEDKVETIDLMNRGGFCALLVAHEAATIAENVSTVPRRKNSTSTKKLGKTGKPKYSSFFEWLERNHEQIDAVFHNIHILSFKLQPGPATGPASPEDAIENEQKVMLLKMTAQDTSDRTIQGGLERAEQARGLHERTAKQHETWKRQGFDALSSGAMKWKLLLRQLKGTHSIWEGGGSYLIHNEGARSTNIDTAREEQETFTKTSQARWKLDLSEGYERQRRRLLPNYEFQKLYNLDRSITNTEDEECIQSMTSNNQVTVAVPEILEHLDDERRPSVLFDQNHESVEATTALLREMKLKSFGRGSRDYLFQDDDDSTLNEGNFDEDFSEDGTDQTATYPDQYLNSSSSITETIMEDSSVKIESMDAEATSVDSDDFSNADEDKNIEASDEIDNIFASSYDVITGILEQGEWPEKSYNVKRCTGLEVRDALLLWCRDAIYIVDGFEQKEGDGLEGKINRLEKSTSTFYVNLRPNDFSSMDSETVNEDTSLGDRHHDTIDNNQQIHNLSRTEKKDSQSHIAEDEVTYQHTSRRISFGDIHSVYRRRYQLQQIALEFFDVHRNGTLVAFSSNSEREEVLTKILSSPLPNSIFYSKNQSSLHTINYDKFMNSLRAKITHEWVRGRVTNFDFIMYLNSFAGRTYNDLTQYPVFPWILSDYESEEIDLDDPKIYRDLSKPMGAQVEERAEQFRERFEVLESNTSMSEHEPPPFHYGTHYSCAAYVLYYLMRLEPFSRLALSLQGGRFDVPDRLFHCVKASWKSASRENLQDVREVIPEFFYFPEFLENNDMFDFGTTQSGKVVHHVTLPPWAKGDPRRFVRINRQVCVFFILTLKLFYIL